ncbi:MAG: hypothetical protein AB7S38_26500 [Vulcanimicrobiota bacterium]
MKTEFIALADSLRAERRFQPCRQAFGVLARSRSWAARRALSTLLDEPRVGLRAAITLLELEGGHLFILKSLESGQCAAQLHCLKALQRMLPLVYPALPPEARESLRDQSQRLARGSSLELREAASGVLRLLPSRRSA